MLTSLLTDYTTFVALGSMSAFVWLCWMDLSSYTREAGLEALVTDATIYTIGHRVVTKAEFAAWEQNCQGWLDIDKSV